MKPEQLLRAILPSVIVDNFDIDRFDKTDTRFDIWLDEKKVVPIIDLVKYIYAFSYNLAIPRVLKLLEVVLFFIYLSTDAEAVASQRV